MGTMIGVLDSGLGGLTVARLLVNQLPEMDITYLGDTARFPYGSRSTGTIVNHVGQGIDFLMTRGAELIVLACVTSSAAWLATGGRKSIVPVVDAVTAAVNRVLTLPACRRIGVVGTQAAVRNRVFENLIRQQTPAAKIYECDTPLLVPLVEDGWLDRPETRMIVKKYLHPLKVRQIDALVMGCNHYAQVKQIFQRKISKRTTLVDCVSSVADSAKEYVDLHMRKRVPKRVNGSQTYYLTDLTDSIVNKGKKMFGRDLTFQLLKL